MKKVEWDKIKTKLYTNKSNVIGVVVLSLGILVLLLVSYFAYQKFYEPVDKIAQSDIDAFRQGGGERGVNRAAGEKPANKYKKQKSISERQIRETWEAPLINGRGLLEIGKGKYRFIIIPTDRSQSRYYSKGSYKLEDNLIILEPNLLWPAPDSSEYKYTLLTRSTMPVMASKHKGKLVWQVPTGDVSIYVPPYHPILDRAKDKIVVWSVLK